MDEFNKDDQKKHGSREKRRIEKKRKRPVSQEYGEDGC